MEKGRFDAWLVAGGSWETHWLFPIFTPQLKMKSDSHSLTWERTST